MDAPVHVPLLLQTQSTHTHSGYYRPEEREENSPRQLCAAILYPPAPFRGSERDVRKAKGEQEETAEGRGPPRPPFNHPNWKTLPSRLQDGILSPCQTVDTERRSNSLCHFVAVSDIDAQLQVSLDVTFIRVFLTALCVDAIGRGSGGRSRLEFQAD